MQGGESPLHQCARGSFYHETHAMTVMKTLLKAGAKPTALNHVSDYMYEAELRHACQLSMHFATRTPVFTRF